MSLPASSAEEGPADGTFLGGRGGGAAIKMIRVTINSP